MSLTSEIQIELQKQLKRYRNYNTMVVILYENGLVNILIKQISSLRFTSGI